MILSRESLPNGTAAALVLLANAALVSSAAFSNNPHRNVLNRRVITASEADEKFKIPPQGPLIWNATVETIKADGKTLCQRSKEVLDKIVAEVTPEEATFENTFLPMIKDSNEVQWIESPAYFYSRVSTDPAMRDASNDFILEVDECWNEQNSRYDVFELIQAVYDKREELDLDPESLRWVEEEHLGKINQGLGLETEEERKRFQEINIRLSELSSEYAKNLNEETGGIWLTPEQLKGVPEDVVGLLQKGEGENEGKLKLTWKYPDYGPFMTWAEDAEARMEAYLGYDNRVPDNVGILKEALILRNEKARMLGYANHAEFRIKDKMAKTPEAVDEFLDDLRTRLAPLMEKEVEHLVEIKKEHLESRGEEFDGKIYYWDSSYYDRIQRQKEFEVDDQLVKEYFPLEQTLDTLMGIFQDLFGFVFVLMEEEDKEKLSPTGNADEVVWHPETIMYAVWDTETFGDDDDGFRGYLYMDLHPRDGKYAHAAMWPLIQGYKNEDTSDRVLPTAILLCNFAKPTATKPSLLRHSEVETLFHELGHAIHVLSGRVHYARFHGTAVARDFVEAPSQMLENWIWTPSVLKNISHHYDTGEPMSDDLIERLIETRHVNDALANTGQVRLALFDMTVHEVESKEELEEMDVQAVYNTLRKELTGPFSSPQDWDPERFPNISWGSGAGTTGHWMGGYDAGYYGYLWSSVYSFDMFYSKFKADPMSGEEGRKYRHMVLEKGGSQEEMDTLTDYLGRAPSTDAFYEELGLVEGAEEE